MRLPDEAREEFVYILPFTPPGKDNMITWLAARSDGAAYGTLVAFKYPKETLIFGPLQVEARINQEPEISSQLSLLNQRGSSVIRGNLLIIPFGDALLYVQPLYLQASTNGLPELQRIIVTTSNQNQGVVMSDRLDTALTALGQGRKGIVLSQPGTTPSPAPSTSPGSTTPGTTTPGSQADLIAQAYDHYQKAQVALKNGDLATYQKEVDAMGAILQQLGGR
jgi:uncharacterized membrane protein (UPF0182 family)